MPMYPRFHLGPGQNQVGGNLEESHGLTEMRPLGVAAHAQVGTVPPATAANPSPTDVYGTPGQNTFKTGNL